MQIDRIQIYDLAIPFRATVYDGTGCLPDPNSEDW